jgi:hypothetical protein
MNKNVILKTEVLQNELKNINLVIFNYIQFEDCIEDNVKSSDIGKILHFPLITFDMNRFNKKVDLKSLIKSFSYVKELYVFENGNFVTLSSKRFEDYDDDYDFDDYQEKEMYRIFDKNYNLIKEALTYKLIGNTESTCCNFGNEIIVHDETFVLMYAIYNLRSLNQDLVIQKSVECRNEYFSICGSSQNIIGLTHEFIDIYDSNLQFLKSVGQSKLYFDSPTEVQILNQKYISKEDQQIRIINGNSCIVKAFINVKAIQMVIQDNKIIVIALEEVDLGNDRNYIKHKKVKDECYEVRVYNLNGNLESKYSLFGYKRGYFLSFKDGVINFALNKDTLELNEY